jgi:hypothetical protein
MSANPIFVGAIKTPVNRLQNSDGTTSITLITGATNGTKVESIAVTSDDTTDRVLQFSISVSGTDYIIGEVTASIGAGTNGTVKAINALNVTDLPWVRNDGINPYLYLESGAILKVKSKVAVTAAKFINIFTQAGDI